MDEKTTVDSHIKPDKIVEAHHLKSPIPLLRLKKEIATINSGEIIQIDCNDTASRNDIINWCHRMKNNYLGEKKREGFISYYISKG